MIPVLHSIVANRPESNLPGTGYNQYTPQGGSRRAFYCYCLNLNTPRSTHRGVKRGYRKGSHVKGTRTSVYSTHPTYFCLERLVVLRLEMRNSMGLREMKMVPYRVFNEAYGATPVSGLQSVEKQIASYHPPPPATPHPRRRGSLLRSGATARLVLSDTEAFYDI